MWEPQEGSMVFKIYTGTDYYGTVLRREVGEYSVTLRTTIISFGTVPGGSYQYTYADGQLTITIDL